MGGACNGWRHRIWRVSPMADQIPEPISRDDIVGAIRDFDAGVPHKFAQSTVFALLWKRRRYPPKAVLGLAIGRINGKQLRPHDFKGGEGSKCFRILRKLGFEIVLKPGAHDYPDEVSTDEPISKVRCKR
jgi:5-methylcytosine-specific restriction enzyme A